MNFRKNINSSRPASSNYSREGNAYHLNAAAIEIPDVIINVGRTKITGPDHIRTLRKAHSTTHVFVRRGDDVVDIPLLEDAKVLGTPENLNLRDDLGIASNLTSEGLIRHLVKHDRKLTDFDPISFLSEAPSDNFLAAIMPAGVTCPEWLAVKAKPEISVRTIWVSNKSQIVAMIFNLWSSNVISADGVTLQAAGIDLLGKYVAVKQKSDDARLRPRYEVLGRVSSIQGDSVFLEDAKYAERTSIKLTDVVLEPRIENLDLCIDAVFGKNAAAIKRKLHERFAEFRSGPARLAKIQSHANYLSKAKIEILPGIGVSVGPLIKQGQSRIFPKIDTLPRPTYVFDPTRQRTHQSHDRGLDEHGPYDQATFSAPNPRVAIICQASKKGRVEQFLRNFLDGMPAVTNKRGVAPYGKGFLRKYCTNAWEVEFFVADGPSAVAYNKAAQQALERAGSTGRKWNLAMVQIEESFRDLPAAANPYLTTKASFLAQSIPSQEFNIETISQSGTPLAYTLNQMALATYAKLGGTPWLLSATPGVAHELIFGLGSANVGGGRFAAQERVVGITTVFKGDGDYILENRSKAVKFEDYPEQILSSLRSTIELLKQRYNWQSGDSIRLIFHAFKPLKNAEVDAVKTLMEEIVKDFNVEYAFVHVVENHPYLLFDENQKGVRDFESGKTKGVGAPTRGHFIQLNRHEALLCLVGAMEVKKAEDGMPSPILLRLHKGSTFVDMTYLARQTFFLSCHSWRTFMPSGMPITITYSNLIANLLGSLSLVPRWNPDAMLGAIGSTRWFL